MAKPLKPSVIQLPGNVKFYPVVLQVIDRDDDGRPRTFQVLRDDEKVKLVGGEEFFVVYGVKELSEMARDWN